MLYSGNGFQARVHFCGTDGKAAATTNAQHANAIAADKFPRTEIIDGGAECFRIHFRCHEIASLSFAFTPIRQVDCQRGKTLFRQFLGIEHGALLFDRPVFFGDFADRPHRLLDTGVVEREVDSTELCYREFYCILDLFIAAYIASENERLATNLLRALFRDVHQEDDCAFLRKDDSGGPPDTARGASDKRHFPCKPLAVLDVHKNSMSVEMRAIAAAKATTNHQERRERSASTVYGVARDSSAWLI